MYWGQSVLLLPYKLPLKQQTTYICSLRGIFISDLLLLFHDEFSTAETTRDTHIYYLRKQNTTPLTSGACGFRNEKTSSIPRRGLRYYALNNQINIRLFETFHQAKKALLSLSFQNCTWNFALNSEYQVLTNELTESSWTIRRVKYEL